jgi:hypothetical protein
MINNYQLRSLIIKPVLKAMSLWSQEAEDLLIGTCAQGSKGGRYLIEESGEPPDVSIKQNIVGIGLYNMTAKMHDEIWRIHLPSKPKIVNDMMQVCCFSRKPTSNMLLYNLYYSTAMARIHYLISNNDIPNTIQLQAEYYKRYWNIENIDFSKKEYIINYNLIMEINSIKESKK